MRKNCFLILLLFSFSFASNAQCWKTINTISTQPGVVGSTNTFDWTQQTAPMYLYDNWNSATLTCPVANITLPMYTQSTSTFQNLNCLDYQSMLPPDKDYQFDDGWELLIKDFGEAFPHDRNVENPMYALYNRYTSKVRVFIMLTSKATSLSLTGAYIELSFAKGYRKTALFQHANPLGFPIQLFETQNPMRVPNYLENKNFYWFTAEFPLAYDPCTCTLNNVKNSQISFRLLANEDATIDAKINGTLYQNVVTSTQPGTNDKSVGINVWGAGLNDVAVGAKKGFEGFKTFEAYRQSFNKGLDQVDAYYKQLINQKIAKAYPNGVPIGGVVVPPNIDALKTTNEGVKFLSGANYDASAVKGLKGIASALPYVGAFLGVVDFLSNMDKQKSATTTAKPTPINYTVDLSFNGTIKKENPINSYTFYTPGTQPNTTPLAMPTYNNILGVINILSIPKLEFVEYKPMSPNGALHPFIELITTNLFPFIPNIRQYRLSDELKYVLNPASNLKVLSAEATYILEYGTGSDGGVIFGTNPQNNTLWVDVDQMPVEFLNTVNDIANLTIPERMVKQGWDLDYLSKDYISYMSGGTGPNSGAFRIRTPYCQLQCFKNVAFNLYHHTITNPNSTSNSTCCRNKAPKLILKIVFKLGKTNGSTSLNNDVITSVISFDMTEAINQADKSKTDFGELNYIFDGEEIPGQTFPIFHARKFEKFPVFPTIINSSELITLENTTIDKDIYAQNKIVIKENVVIKAGINLYAGETITTNTTLHSPDYGNVSFNISKTNLCNREVESAHESEAEIISRCNSTEYRDKAGANKILSVKDTTKQNETISDFEIQIAPNPNTGNFAVLTSLNGLHEIFISDLTGKIVFENTYLSSPADINGFDKGYFFRVNCDAFLRTGMYLLKVRVDGQNAVERILITK